MALPRTRYCSLPAAESMRGELETKRSTMTSTVRDTESLRERLLGEVGRVRHNMLTVLHAGLALPSVSTCHQCMRNKQPVPCFWTLLQVVLAFNVLSLSYLTLSAPLSLAPSPQAETRLSAQRAAVEEAEAAVQEALRRLHEAEVSTGGVTALATTTAWPGMAQH